VLAERTQFEGVPFTLAVCAEMVFRGLPMVERVKRIRDLGFQVEIWDWTKHDINSLAATGATFSSMTGYVTGSLTDDDGADDLIRTASSQFGSPTNLGFRVLTSTARGWTAVGFR
jgi:hydroxypyruvate isomerase